MYLSMLGLWLNYGSKKGPWAQLCDIKKLFISDRRFHGLMEYLLRSMMFRYGVIVPGRHEPKQELSLSGIHYTQTLQELINHILQNTLCSSLKKNKVSILYVSR